MISSALELFDLNCSDARSACESPTDLSTLFGQPVVGSCVPDTGICMCPSGYSGEDDWAIWNDCHINETRRWEVLIASLVIDGVALIVCLSSLIRLGYRYGFSVICMPLNSDEIHHQLSVLNSMGAPPADMPTKRKSIAFVASGLLSSITSGSLDQTNRTPGFVAIAKERRRKSQSILLLLLFFGFSSLSCLYHAMLLAGYKRHDNHWYFDLVMCAAAVFILWSLWTFMYLWYNSLPSLRYYGKLFNLNGFLVRHPNFVGQVSTLHNIAGAFVTLILVVILPAVFPKSRSNFDTMLLVFLLVYVADFVIALLVVCAMLLKCFRQYSCVSPNPGRMTHGSSSETLVSANDLSSKHQEFTSVTRDEQRRDPFARARQTVQVVRAFAIMLGALAIGLFTFMTWIPAGRKNLYLFFNVISWHAGLVVVGCSWILVFRTTLRPKPSEENRVTNRQSSKTKGAAAIPEEIVDEAAI